MDAARRVLIVDDHRSVADTLAIFFKLEGFEVRTAYNGKDAVATARDFEPALVMLDLTMPGVSGLEAGQQILAQSQGAEIVLVALTGHEDDENIRRTREAGFHHHLVKPVEPEILRELIASIDFTDGPASGRPPA